MPQSRYSSWSVVDVWTVLVRSTKVTELKVFSFHFISSSDGHWHRNAERPSSRWELFIVLLGRLNLRLKSSTVGRFVVFDLRYDAGVVPYTRSLAGANPRMYGTQQLGVPRGRAAALAPMHSDLPWCRDPVRGRSCLQASAAADACCKARLGHG